MLTEFHHTSQFKMFEATIIKDSWAPTTRKRLTTFQLCYPRFIHGEVMTHRVFSRNAMSSRAIPVARMLAQVRDNPAMPVHWGANQPGMQAGVEVGDIPLARQLWYGAARQAAQFAEQMADMGLHKQVANRILEPFQWMRTIVTATEWDNFWELRAHPDAQPEFQKLAYMMLDAYKSSKPEDLLPGQWHLPYVIEEDSPYDLRKVSAARCARVSYLTHDGEQPDPLKDLALFDRLAASRPLHASPLEHQGTPGTERTGTFQGWTQFRKLWELEV